MSKEKMIYVKEAIPLDDIVEEAKTMGYNIVMCQGSIGYITNNKNMSDIIAKFGEVYEVGVDIIFPKTHEWLYLLYPPRTIPRDRNHYLPEEECEGLMCGTWNGTEWLCRHYAQAYTKSDYTNQKRNEETISVIRGTELVKKYISNLDTDLQNFIGKFIEE